MKMIIKKILCGTLAAGTLFLAGCSPAAEQSSSDASSPYQSEGEVGSSDGETSAEAPSEGSMPVISGSTEAPSNPSNPSETAKYPNKVKLTILDRGDQTAAEKLKNDAIVQYLEARFNIELNLIYYPSPTQSEVYQKLNMLIAAKQIPDLMVTRPDYAVARDVHEVLATGGELVDVRQYVKDNAGKYPNIAKVVNHEQSNAYQASDGKLYALPRKYVYDHAFIYRQDWLDRLGLKMPQNQDDFYHVLKAFVQNDPDKKGTTGLTMTYGFWFDHIFTAFTGAQKFYKDTDGSHKSVWRLSAQREALKYCRRLYAEKLLDQNVFTNTPEKDELAAFVTGRAGVLLTGAVTNLPYVYQETLKNNPNAKLSLGFWNGPAGPAHVREKEAFYEATAIYLNKAKKNDKANQDRIARIFDLLEYLLSDSGAQLTGYGIADVHYTKEGNSVKMKPGTESALPSLMRPEKHPIRRIARADAVFDSYITSQPWGTLLMNYYNDYCLNKKYGAYNPCDGFDALLPKAVNIQVGNKPELTVQKWEMQFITGQADINNDAVWKACWNDLVLNKMQTLEQEYTKLGR